MLTLRADGAEGVEEEVDGGVEQPLLADREAVRRAIIAYSHIHVLAALLVLLLIPLLLLVRMTKGAGGSHAVMERRELQPLAISRQRRATPAPEVR